MIEYFCGAAHREFDTFPSIKQAIDLCRRIDNNMKTSLAMKRPVVEEQWETHIEGCSACVEGLMLVYDRPHIISEENTEKVIRRAEKILGWKEGESKEVYEYWRNGEFHPMMKSRWRGL